MMEIGGPFLDQLIGHGLLIPSGIDGLYGRSGAFESVVDGLEAAITRAGRGDGAEVMRFPPGLNRVQFERSDYMKTFPHFAGTVHCFCGGEPEHREILRCIETGEDWTGQQQASDIVLTPAACYPVYPVIAARGALPEAGALVDVMSYCFRHEPSLEPTRLQMFRMREYVFIGSPDQVLAFRAGWLERGQAMVRGLALPHEIDVANDPFFGRAGKVMANSQRELALKFELLVPVNSREAPTACLSFNYHLDHFGRVWDIKLPDGGVAHTACVGFGLERLTMALLRHHGLDIAAWPDAVRATLWP
jgi:seryl-tRNA synthetase